MLVVHLAVWIRLPVNMDLSDFYEAPCAVFLDSCKKDQLVEIAEHYGIVLQEGLLKDELKMFVLLSLFEMGVLQKEPAAEPAAAAAVRPESAPVPVG